MEFEVPSVSPGSESLNAPFTSKRRRELDALASMTILPSTPRAVRMAREYFEGSTLAEIGERFGRTRERVRQLIRDEAGYSTKELKAYRELLADEEFRMKRAAAVSWSERHVGVPISVASQDLSLSQQELRRLLGKRVKFHLGEAKPRKTSSATPDEVLLSALREFYEETGETAAQSFTQWSRSHGVPTHQTVANRFGGWNAALERAGIAVTDRRRSRSKYSDAELVEALVDAWSSATPPRTYLELSDWLSARPGMPSAALIRNRLGVGFEEMRARALRVVAGQSMGFPGRKRTRVDWKGKLDPGDDPLTLVRRAIEDRGPRLTVAAYNSWAAEHGVPAMPTVLRRAGTNWVQLVEAAGGTPNPPKPANPFTTEELRVWMERFMTESATHSQSAHEEWRLAHGGPSAQTITTRLGPWREVLENLGGGQREG
ncbi:homing endonuclease associated repeat-containing protein [Micrococcus endophyticus]|uniref:homing endonuclease associated repeat-containing protein n=1 Tax=Micrococcus endophyticus TaxID=455343 RepID=UPI0034CEA3F2